MLVPLLAHLQPSVSQTYHKAHLQALAATQCWSGPSPNKHWDCASGKPVLSLLMVTQTTGQQRKEWGHGGGGEEKFWGRGRWRQGKGMVRGGGNGSAQLHQIYSPILDNLSQERGSCFCTSPKAAAKASNPIAALLFLPKWKGINIPFSKGAVAGCLAHYWYSYFGTTAVPVLWASWTVRPAWTLLSIHKAIWSIRIQRLAWTVYFMLQDRRCPFRTLHHVQHIPFVVNICKQEVKPSLFTDLLDFLFQSTFSFSQHWIYDSVPKISSGIAILSTLGVITSYHYMCRQVSVTQS